MAQVLPMLTRARAFYSCGVLLNLPAHSRSGVRNDDGIVVFAPKEGRMLGRRRTGQMSGDVTIIGAGGQMSLKQSFTYTNTLDAVR